MDVTNMDVTNTMRVVESRQIPGKLSRWWWIWLVTGLLWIAFAASLAPLRNGFVSTDGIILGVMFLLAGAQEIASSSVPRGWKWLWIAVSVILILGGICALLSPVHNDLVVRSLLVGALMLTGIFWVIEAFATKAGNDLWWPGLLAGLLLIGPGFKVGGHSLSAQLSVVVIAFGIWALAHGTTDIVKAFTIKRLGTTMPLQDALAPLQPDLDS